MKHLLLFTSLALASASLSAHAAEPITYGSLKSGNLYEAMPPATRSVYVAGVVDGLLLAPNPEEGKLIASKLSRCTKGWQLDQIVNVVNKFHVAHPETWDDDMALAVYDALRDACHAKGIDLNQ
jgi:hypothetical protein